MNLAQAIAAARSARDADRGLTLDEFNGIRDAKQRANPATDDEELGTLGGIERSIARQEIDRTERARVAAEQERGRQHQEKIDARVRRWNELMDTNMTAANLYSMAEETRSGPVTARQLMKHLPRKDRRPPPRTFEPDLLSEFERVQW